MMLSDPRTLAVLINEQTDSELLEATIEGVLDQLLRACLSQRELIDEHVAWLVSIAADIDTAIATPARPREYRFTMRHAGSGPGVLYECLKFTLFERLWPYTSRAVTPDEEDDKTLPARFYSYSSVYATVLARAFATQPVLRRSLWPVIEDMFVKGLFSGNQPELEVFVVLAALFLGSGPEIRTYMAREGFMARGADWLWYNDERCRPDDVWDWNDVVLTMKQRPDAVDVEPLPGYVKDSFEMSKVYLQDSNMLESWDSQRLAKEAFPWVNLSS